MIAAAFFSMFSNLHEVLWWQKLCSGDLTVKCIRSVMFKLEVAQKGCKK